MENECRQGNNDFGNKMVEDKSINVKIVKKSYALVS